jgi:FMN phosphatase YigB (HAD superfamily)
MQSLNNNLPKNKKLPIILFDIDYSLFDTGLFKETNLEKFSLYPEVVDVLSELSKEAILGIFSEGEEEFQKTKLKTTKIDHFFHKDHMYIEKEKEKIIEKIKTKYKDASIIIVDDKLPMLSLTKKQNPHAFTIWIKRGEYAKNQKQLPDFTPDAEIDNLSEIIPLINSGYGLTLHSH